MKIWVLEIGEPLPLEPNVRLHRYGQFTKYLAQRGHDVTWWTSSFSHTPKKHFAQFDGPQICDGVRLWLIRGLGYPRNISFARIRHNQHFARRFAELAPGEERPDLIIAPIPIIEAAKEAVSFGRAHNIPVLTDIRDLWPDELRDRAPKHMRPIARILLARSYRQMTYVCQNVTGIMGVSQTFMKYGLEFAGRERRPQDVLFPLGYASKPISESALQEGMNWCREMGLREDHFIVAFFGTIGEYFDLETAIHSARILKNKMPLQMVLAGTGSRLDHYRKQAKDLDCVFFPGWLDAPKIAAVMKMAKVGLAPYRKDANMTLPNKPFEYMAGSLPIVSSIQRELPEILKEANCGMTYEADSVEALSGALQRLYTHEDERREMGARGRKLFEKRFANEVVFEQVENHLRNVTR